MKNILLLLFFLPVFGCAQAPENRPKVSDNDFDKKLTTLLDFEVPLIGVDELQAKQGEVKIFDTREKEEYEVSHIPGAVHLGYDHFDEKILKNVPKDASIVLYCSVGYRSEKIGERLQKMGFKNVKNLYGSIFEWMNRGNPVVDKSGKNTFKIHTYNKNWSRWVSVKKAEKIW